MDLLRSTLVFSICRNSLKKWIRKKTAFVSVFTMFLRGVHVVGGVTIHIYIYTYIYIYIYIYIYVCNIHIPININLYDIDT